MFDTVLVKTARDGRTLGLTYWAPMLPSFQFPTVTWTDGVTESVARVDFPEGQPIAITCSGPVEDADVQPLYLDRGWVLRSTP